MAEFEADADRRRLLLLGTVGAAALGVGSAQAQTPLGQGATPMPLSKTKVEERPAEKEFAPLDVGQKAVEFLRNSVDQTAWDSLRTIAQTLLSVTSDGTVSGELLETFRRIDSGFHFEPHPNDIDFSLLHIEPLLDQAADLLDRGIRDRAVWDELASRWLLLALEIGEYAEIDQIHTEEEANGYYDHSAHTSSAEYKSESINSAGQSYNSYLTEHVYENYFDYASLNKIFGADQRAAWLNGLVPYSWQDQSFAGYVSHTWVGDSEHVNDHSLKAAQIRQDHDLSVQALSWKLEESIYQNFASVSKERVVGLAAQATWDSKDSSFQRRRTIVSRRFEDIKAKAAIAPDGLLNYAKRLVALRARFQNDFRDALARIMAVSPGLKAVYGFDLPLPTSVGTIDYFDDCLLWNRQAIQSVIRFSRRDQSAILPISVAELAQEAEWKKILAGDVGFFDLPESMFDGMTHVRLRGVGAAITDAEVGHRLWSIDAAVPPEGTFKWLDGNMAKVDQSDLPPCRLTRATRRIDTRDVDVVGVSALHNASPIGRWKVRIRGSVPRVAKYDAYIHDIVLDLHVAFRQPGAHV